MPANITYWPFPRVLSTQHKMFGFLHSADRNALFMYEVYYDGSDWEALFLGAFEYNFDKIAISIADFGPFYTIALYGSYADESTFLMTYIRDISTNTPGECLSDQLEPAYGTCCNFNQQCVAGNIVGEADSIWEELGTNAIVWSGIGNFNFDPAQDITAGFMQLFFSGVNSTRAIIHRILPVERGVIIYSNAGLCLCAPSAEGNTFTYGCKSLPGLGINSANHVAGDSYTHGFIDLANDFYLFSEGTLEKRGYREWIKELVDEHDDIIVSYLPRDKRFYISNGAQCLVINEFGAYKCHQRVSSVIQTFDGVLHGTYSDNESTIARVVTDSLDFGSRGLKSVENMRAQLSTEANALAQFAVDWRSTKSNTFQRSVLKSAGPTGEANVMVTALDFRLVLQIDSYEECELTSVLANVKYSDQRFKRGTVPSQYTIGTT